MCILVGVRSSGAAGYGFAQPARLDRLRAAPDNLVGAQLCCAIARHSRALQRDDRPA